MKRRRLFKIVAFVSNLLTAFVKTTVDAGFPPCYYFIWLHVTDYP